MRGTTCDYHGQSPKPFHYADNDYCWECDEKMVKALAAVERIRELHKPAEDDDRCTDPDCCDLEPECTGCNSYWPCETIQALDGVKP